jgi:hypothetical protein
MYLTLWQPLQYKYRQEEGNQLASLLARNRVNRSTTTTTLAAAVLGTASINQNGRVSGACPFTGCSSVHVKTTFLKEKIGRKLAVQFFYYQESFLLSISSSLK